jgi:hypothetical protein
MYAIASITIPAPSFFQAISSRSFTCQRWPSPKGFVFDAVVPTPGQFGIGYEAFVTTCEMCRGPEDRRIAQEEDIMRRVYKRCKKHQIAK